MNPNTQNFFSVVTNPFTPHISARVTDNWQGKSLCLTDYQYQVQPTADFDSSFALAGVNGYLLLLQPCYTDFRAFDSSLMQGLYGVIAQSVTTGGVITSANGHEYVNFFRGDNYSTITGSTTSFDENTDLICEMRLFAAGIRVWPVLEYVTDSTSNYMTGIYSGLIKTEDLHTAFTNGTDIRPIIRNAPEMMVYSNALGCTVRLDPFQHRDYLQIRTFQDVQDGNTFDGSTMLLPFIYITTSKNIAEGDPFPFYFSVQYWIEGSLRQPSPIFSDTSPVDLEYDKQVIVYQQAKYPISSEGHTFKGFASTMRKFNKAAGVALRYSQMLTNGEFQRAAHSAVEDLGNYVQRKNASKMRRRTRRPDIGTEAPFVDKSTPNRNVGSEVNRPSRNNKKKKNGKRK